MSDFHLFDITNSIEHELPVGKTVLGRSAECDIRLLSSSVSRRHSMLEVVDDKLIFSDLGSSNGSFVNGKPVTAPVAVHNADELTLGDLRFSVNYAGDTTPNVDTNDNDATQLAGANDSADIPAMWSENSGLENASGTQVFSEPAQSPAVAAYRKGLLNIPALGDRPRLVGLNGEIKGKVFALTTSTAGKTRTRTWKIGRDAESVDLVIVDPSVSGQHAQLVNEDARWKVVNWMSTNGTFVNGQKGLSTYLKSGDIIRMGSSELAFELPAGGGKSTAGGGLFGRFRNRGG